MRYLVLLVLGSLFFTNNDFELKIYNHSLSDNDLNIYYSIKNNTNECSSVYLGNGWSTIPYLSNLSVLITINDTLALHIYNPFSGYPSREQKTIMPNDSICGTIEINLSELYLFSQILSDNPVNYPIKSDDECSLQLIYFSEFNLHEKTSILGKKSKIQCLPITDTLHSNILLYSK